MSDDLTERARAILREHAPAPLFSGPYCKPLMTAIAAALQSEREAAARAERNSWADAIRERQKGKPDLDLAGIKACAEAALIRPGHVIANAREVLAMIELIEAREAAAAEARIAAIEECLAEVKSWLVNTGGMDTGLLKALLRALASPAPQEKPENWEQINSMTGDWR